MYTAVSNAAMSDERHIRLEHLKAACVRLRLVKEDGTPSPGKLAERIDRKTNYCSDLLLGRRSFGEDIARHIEERLNLGKWALDGGAGWPFPGIDRDRYDRLTREQQLEIQGAVRSMITTFEATPDASASGKRAQA